MRLPINARGANAVPPLLDGSIEMSKRLTRRMAVGALPLLAFEAAWIARIRQSTAQPPPPNITTIDTDLTYAEGLLIHDGQIYVADIIREQIIIYDTVNFQRQHVIQLSSCGPTSIAPFQTDKVLVTCHMAAYLHVMSPSGDFKGDIMRTIGDRPIPWPNDSTSDGEGGVFLTSSGVFDTNAPATGAVMHVSSAAQVKVMVEKLHYANGITYDPKTRELFVTEHLANRIFVFVLDELFGIRERRVFFDLNGLPEPNVPPFPEMGPDNLHFRANGDLIVPNYGAGRFLIISRSGQLKQIVAVPCQFITDAAELDGDILFTGAFDVRTRDLKGVLGRVHMG
jgi:sugar lactone lactonase YvrE